MKKSSSKKRGGWSSERHAKFKATFAARKAAKDAMPPHVQDALAFLLKAEAALIRQHATGNKRFGSVETLAMLALNTLRGEM